MPEVPAAQSFQKRETGALTIALYRRVLDAVIGGAILTFTASNGREERIFFFTRGAILYLAVGPEGGEVLAKKAIEKGLLGEAQLEPMIKKAHSGKPLLQDVLEQDGALAQEEVRALVNEVLEERLAELAYWDGALYDLNPGNPPPRLYDQDVPAVRLSLGMKPLVERVVPKVDQASEIMAALGGSLRHKLKLPTRHGMEPPATADEGKIIGRCRDIPRPIVDVLADARANGLPLVEGLSTLAALVRQRRVLVVKVAEKTKEEERAHALAIDAAFEGFVNRLLARSQLAAIYERIQDSENAGIQYRGIADEHLAHERVQDGLAALEKAVGHRPLDVGSRELMIKVLRGLNRTGDAAREAISLARTLLDVGLPNRARYALEMALKLVPGAQGVLWMLAGLLGRLGDREEAINRYNEIAGLAEARNDEAQAIAAYQQILDLDPRHSGTLGKLRKLTGQGRALLVRYSAAATAVFVALLVVAYAAFELKALQAYSVAKEEAWRAIEQDKLDVARSRVNQFTAAWPLSRFASAGKQLLARIDEEERALQEQRAGQDVRAARKLEADGNLPAALDRFTAAKGSEDEKRKAEVAAAIARLEGRVRTVRDAQAVAEQHLQRGADREAYEALARVIPQAPWLKDSPDVLLPVRLESVPPGAKVTIDGRPLEKPTPITVRRPPVPGTVVFQRQGRDQVQKTLEAVPPWPFSVVLPRKPAWRSPVVASSAPALIGDLVVVAGRDRSVAALARGDGTTKWRNLDALGVFGESHLPPAGLVAEKLVVARADAGLVAGLELDTGATRWTKEVTPPPLDVVEPACGRPVAVPGGVAVRDGPRTVVCLDPVTGAQRWKSQARADGIGALVASGGKLYLASERTLSAWNASDGTLAWAARLPRPAVTGAAAGPKGTVHVALESGAVARIDTTSGEVTGQDKVTDSAGIACVPDVQGDRMAVGLMKGEVVVTVVSTGAVAFRAAFAAQRPVLWVRVAEPDLVLASDGTAIVAFDAKGGEAWRQPLESQSDNPESAPAASDAQRVYLGGDLGLVAVER